MVELNQQIIQSAIDYKNNPNIPTLLVKDYARYIQTGDRLKFENSYFERRRRLSVLALAMILGESTKDELEQTIWDICNEYSWSLPAHLPIVDDTYSSESDRHIDLFAAETGQALAEIKHILGNQLSLMIQNRIDAEIEKRILSSFEEKKWGWETLENNWSAVIGGCLGMIILYQLPKNSLRQLTLLKRVKECLTFYLKSFGEDGACEEGLGYWAYGFGYYIYFSQLYLKVFQCDDYLVSSKIKKIASFPKYVMIDEYNGIPFSDYFPSELPSGLLSFCNEYFDLNSLAVSGKSNLDFDECYRFAHLYRNLVWTRKNAAGSYNHMKYFPDIEWGIRMNSNNQVFACKGGRNDESHNHIDIGHFIFGTKEELFLTDIGAGEYTKNYFDEKKRYSYLNPSALGHSIPIVNKHYQNRGDVKAENTLFYFDKNQTLVFETNLSTTYTDVSDLLQLRRRIICEETQSQIILTDSFKFKNEEENSVIENFITTKSVEIEGEEVYIYGNTDYLCKMNFDKSVTSLKSMQVEYRKHDGKIAYATLIQASYLVSLEQNIIVKIAIQKKSGV